MIVRGKATPEAFSVCTNSGFAPGEGRKRMFARRAWKSSNVDALAVMASGKRAVREEVYRLLERLHHPLAIIQDEAA